MANLTITIEADTLARARAKALERGTSVNAVVREHLEAYAGASPAARALAEFLDLADRAGGTSAAAEEPDADVR